MSRTIWCLLLSVAVAGAIATPAGAGTRQCLQAAAVDYQECKGNCKEDYQVAKDACNNKDHVCMEACREERADCRDATGFDNAIKACNAAVEDAIGNCKQIYGPGTDERDRCIDNAQLDGFRCRDQVRE